MDARKGVELLLTPGITPEDWELLEATFRNADTPVCRGSVAAILGRLDLSPVKAADIDTQLIAMTRAGARLVFRWDAEYPPRLRTVSMAPPALFIRGRLPASEKSAVAIVGTRKPSAPGSAFAHNLARSLSQLGITIVSGMARGIDTAAHNGALAAEGSTVAVLGTGVDVVYPPENGALLGRIAETGGVVSEQVCGTLAFPQVFPKRNRIISGLCDAVVVVEGGAKSGALITARWGLEQGRDVGAVPGFPGGFRSEGPNQLIKQGAFVVEDAMDVVTNVKRIAEEIYATARAHIGEDAARDGLDGEAARVYDVVANGASADDVALAAGISIERAQSLLAMLEIEGRVCRDEGGNFARITRAKRR
jgi:DNA processing protein